MKTFSNYKKIIIATIITIAVFFGSAVFAIFNFGQNAKNENFAFATNVGEGFDNQTNDYENSFFNYSNATGNETVADDYWGGNINNTGSTSGDVEVDLEISSAQELANFMVDINNRLNSTYNKTDTYVQLSADIDLSEKLWIPIGSGTSSNTYFQGTFDGNGYTISGLRINNTYTGTYVGLFGYVYGAEIINLTIENAQIVSSDASYIGNIAGKAINTKFNNCGVDSFSSLETDKSSTKMGSVLGDGSNVEILSSYSYANIINSNITNDNAVGYTGVAGLAGNVYSSTISNCFFYGYVNNEANGYGIACANESSTISNCYTNNKYSIKGFCTKENVYAGGAPTTSPNTTFWVQDVSGVMHGVENVYVLKGVGNISFEYQEYYQGNAVISASGAVNYKVYAIGSVNNDLTFVSENRTGYSFEYSKMNLEVNNDYEDVVEYKPSNDKKPSGSSMPSFYNTYSGFSISTANQENGFAFDDFGYNYANCLYYLITFNNQTQGHYKIRFNTEDRIIERAIDVSTYSNGTEKFSAKIEYRGIDIDATESKLEKITVTNLPKDESIKFYTFGLEDVTITLTDASDANGFLDRTSIILNNSVQNSKNFTSDDEEISIIVDNRVELYVDYVDDSFDPVEHNVFLKNAFNYLNDFDYKEALQPINCFVFEDIENITKVQGFKLIGYKIGEIESNSGIAIKGDVYTISGKNLTSGKNTMYLGWKAMDNNFDIYAENCDRVELRGYNNQEKDFNDLSIDASGIKKYNYTTTNGEKYIIKVTLKSGYDLNEGSFNENSNNDQINIQGADCKYSYPYEITRIAETNDYTITFKHLIDLYGVVIVPKLVGYAATAFVNTNDNIANGTITFLGIEAGKTSVDLKSQEVGIDECLNLGYIGFQENTTIYFKVKDGYKIDNVLIVDEDGNAIDKNNAKSYIDSEKGYLSITILNWDTELDNTIFFKFNLVAKNYEYKINIVMPNQLDENVEINSVLHPDLEEIQKYDYLFDTTKNIYSFSQIITTENLFNYSINLSQTGFYYIDTINKVEATNLFSYSLTEMAEGGDYEKPFNIVLARRNIVVDINEGYTINNGSLVDLNSNAQLAGVPTTTGNATVGLYIQKNATAPYLNLNFGGVDVENLNNVVFGRLDSVLINNENISANVSLIGTSDNENIVFDISIVYNFTVPTITYVEGKIADDGVTATIGTPAQDVVIENSNYTNVALKTDSINGYTFEGYYFVKNNSLNIDINKNSNNYIAVNDTGIYDISGINFYEQMYCVCVYRANFVNFSYQMTGKFVHENGYQEEIALKDVDSDLTTDFVESGYYNTIDLRVTNDFVVVDRNGVLTFAGWASTENGIVISNATSLTQDATLYPIFKAKYIGVHFVYPNNQKTTQSFEYGSVINNVEIEDILPFYANSFSYNNIKILEKQNGVFDCVSEQSQNTLWLGTQSTNVDIFANCSVSVKFSTIYGSFENDLQTITKNFDLDNITQTITINSGDQEEIINLEDTYFDFAYYTLDGKTMEEKQVVDFDRICGGEIELVAHFVFKDTIKANLFVNGENEKQYSSVYDGLEREFVFDYTKEYFITTSLNYYFNSNKVGGGYAMYKNVADSGNYYYTATFNATNVTEKTIFSNTALIEILKADLTFGEEITKTYDAKVDFSTQYVLNGVNGETIENVVVNFVDGNVGENKALEFIVPTALLSNYTNSYTNLTGTITKATLDIFVSKTLYRQPVNEGENAKFSLNDIAIYTIDNVGLSSLNGELKTQINVLKSNIDFYVFNKVQSCDESYKIQNLNSENLNGSVYEYGTKTFTTISNNFNNSFFDNIELNIVANVDIEENSSSSSQNSIFSVNVINDVSNLESVGVNLVDVGVSSDILISGNGTSSVQVSTPKLMVEDTYKFTLSGVNENGCSVGGYYLKSISPANCSLEFEDGEFTLTVLDKTKNFGVQFVYSKKITATINYNFGENEIVTGTESVDVGYELTSSQTCSLFGKSFPTFERKGFEFAGLYFGAGLYYSPNTDCVVTINNISFSTKQVLGVTGIEVQVADDFTLDASWTLAKPNLDLAIIKDKTASVEILNYNSVISYTYAWRNSKGVIFSTNKDLVLNNASEAGNYTLTVTANYKNSTATATTGNINVGFNKYELNINIGDIQIEYCANNATGTVSVSVEDSNIDVAYATQGKNIGEYNASDIVFSFPNSFETNNYTITYAGKITIFAKQLTINIGELEKEFDNAIYRGESNTLNFVFENNNTAAIKYNFETKSANAGIYEASNNSQMSFEIVSVIENGNVFNQDDILAQNILNNYTFEYLGQVEISGCLIENIAWSNNEFVFDNTSKTTFVTDMDSKTGVVSVDDESIVKITYSVDGITASSVSVVNAGVYNIVATIKVLNGNYVFADESSEASFQTQLTIAKRKIEISLASTYQREYSGNCEINDIVFNIADLASMAYASASTSIFDGISIISTFENKNVGNDKKIITTLDGGYEYNSNFELETKFVFGNIVAKQVYISGNFTKQYDSEICKISINNLNFVDANNQNILGLLNSENISGYINFDMSNVGNYNISNILIGESTNVDSENAFDFILVENIILSNNANYIIKNVNIDVIITTVTVCVYKNKTENTIDTSYVYNGNAVEIEYVLVREDKNQIISGDEVTATLNYAIKTETEIDAESIKIYDDFEKSNSVAPYYVGGYTVTFTLDNGNYVFDNGSDNTKIDFFITKKIISFEFEVDFDYDGTKKQISLNQNDISAYTTSSVISLDTNEILNFEFVTGSGELGAYNLFNNDQGNTRNISVTKGEFVTTNAYRFNEIQNSAVIKIIKGNIDTEKLTIPQSVVYNGEMQQIVVSYENQNGENEFGLITYLSFTPYNESNSVDISGASDVIYAGTYSYRVEFENYSFENSLSKTFEFVIVPKEINLFNEQTASFDYEITKQYDNTNAVALKAGVNDADYLCESSSSLNLRYETTSVANGINVLVSVINANQFIVSSYKVVGSYSADITKREIEVDLSSSFEKFYDNQKIEIGYSMLNFINIVGGDIIQGKIVISVFQSGTYNFKDIAEQIKLEFIGEENYDISINSQSTKTITIKKAVVICSPSKLTYEYTGKQIKPAFDFEISYGEMVEELETSVNYFLQTDTNTSVDFQNVGVYDCVVEIFGNYTFGKYNSSLDLVCYNTTTFTLEITAKQITISFANEQKYSGTNCVYSVVNDDVAGIVSSHTITGQFTTQDSAVDIYSTANGKLIQSQNIVILDSANADVTNNYHFDINGVIEIKAWEYGDVDTSLLDGLVYNKQNQTISVTIYKEGNPLLITYGSNLNSGTAVLENLVYKNNSEHNQVANQVVFAGEYSITLRYIDGTPSQVIDFAVNTKLLTISSSNNFEKLFDGTNAVNEICSLNGVELNDDVSYNAVYQSATVGNDIVVEVTLLGDDSFNYYIENTKGSILTKVVTISFAQSLTYCGENQKIVSANIQTDLQSCFTLAGYATTSIVNVGVYNVKLSNFDLSNLQVLDSSNNNVTANYSFAVAGDLEINKLVVNITKAANFEDYNYTGKVVDIKDYLQYDCNAKLKDEVAKSLTITYSTIGNDDVKPVNAGSYTASFETKSQNFDVSASEIDFEIFKINLNIAVSTTVAYSETSNHKTQLSTSNAQGIVANQTLTGNFALKNTGANVGIYTYGNNDIDIFDISIMVNGENIALVNYVITFDITLEITHFVVENIFIVDLNNIIYNSQNSFEDIQISFINADGENNIISVADNESNANYNIILKDVAEAVNAGDYSIELTYDNYKFKTQNMQNAELSVVLNYTVNKFTLTTINFDANKIYDGTNKVYLNGSDILESSQVFAGDSVGIVGYYSSADAISQENDVYTISFEFDNDISFGDNSNYNLLLEKFVGKIVKREIIIGVVNNIQMEYIANEQYILDINMLQVTSSLQIVGGEVLYGNLIVSRQNIGSIGLSDEIYIVSNNLYILKQDDSSSLHNYNITFEGELNIVERSIELDFAGIANNYVYNNQNVQIVPNIVVAAEFGGAVDFNDFTISYEESGQLSSSAVDVGYYTAMFTAPNNFTISSTNSFNFNISPYYFEIASGEIPQNMFKKSYGSSDIEIKYTIKLSDNIGNVTVFFTRESGENVGTYDIFVDTCSNTNCIASIYFNNKLFSIVKESVLTVTITAKTGFDLSKVYNNENIAAIDIANFELSCGQGEVVGTIIFASGSDVGSYDYVSHTLSSLNYSSINVVCDLTYAITPLDVEFVANASEYSKIYDKTNVSNVVLLPSTIVYNNFAVNTTYSSTDVASDIVMNYSFLNDKAENYNITLPSTLGTITKRDITVTAVGATYEYGVENISISYQVSENDYVDQLSGSLEISYKTPSTKYIAGGYDIEQGSLSSSNLNIIFVSDIITITKKLITIEDSNNFVKAFDSSAVVNNSGFNITGLIGSDEVFVSAVYVDEYMQQDASVGISKTVIFTLFGADGQNYYANNTTGSISDKIVILNYDYCSDSLINGELISGTDVASISLVYGSEFGKLTTPNHEGYTFEGWYFDSEYTNPIANDTIISSLNWNVDEVEKTAFAKWSIKSFAVDFKIATYVNGMYEENVAGGSVNYDSQTKFEYYSYASLQSFVSANVGYDFKGLSYALNQEIDDTLLSVGLLIKATQNIVWVKFAPSSLTFTLNANGGNFVLSNGWAISTSKDVATKTISFGTTLQENGLLPTLEYTGHSFARYENSVNEILDITKVYTQDQTFDAIYDTNSYYITFDANGGYFEDTLSFDIVAQDENNNVTKVGKDINYGEIVGTIPVPTYLGYTFANWDNNVDENFVYDVLDNKTYLANYTENYYDLEIESQFLNYVYNIYDSQNQLIKTESIIAGNAKVANFGASYVIEIVAQDTNGYTLSSYSVINDYANEDIASDLNISLISNTKVVINATESLFNLNIYTNDTNSSYVQVVIGSNIYDSSILGNINIDNITRSSVIEIEVIFIEQGYVIKNYNVICNDLYNLSDNNTSANRTLTNVLGNIEIEIQIENRLNSISVNSNSQISFEYAGESNLFNKQINIATGETLEFVVYSAHGYKIDTNISSWVFDTLSSQKGTFELDGDEDILTVKLTGFVVDGSIEIPYVYEEFTINIISKIDDNNVLTDANTKNLVISQMTNITTSQSADIISGDSFVVSFNDEYILNVQNALSGYSFKAWSISGDEIIYLTTQNGLVSIEDNGTITLNSIDNCTLYIVYTKQIFDVSFVTNNNAMGKIAYNGNNYNEFTLKMEYGDDIAGIEAICSNGFNLQAWVVVENGVETIVSTQSMLEYTDVASNVTFKAVFVGNEISVIVNLCVADDQLIENFDLTNFASIEDEYGAVVENYSQNGQIITYTLSSTAFANFGFRLSNINNYYYSSIKIDPKSSYVIDDDNFSFSYLTEDSVIDLYFNVNSYNVTFKINDYKNGANLSYIGEESISVVNGTVQVTSYELIAQVRYDGIIAFSLSFLKGYKLGNISGNVDALSVPQYMDSLNDYYNYIVSLKLTNISSNQDIIIDLLPYTYNVTLNKNYNNEIFNSQINYGAYAFATAVPQSFSNPQREGYNFVCYSSKSDGSGTCYYFDANGLYTIIKKGSNYERIYAFLGSEDCTNSIYGYDYDLTLYANWSLITYKVDVVFVPATTILNEIKLDNLLPQTNGRYCNFNVETNKIDYISYVSGSLVTIDVPSTLYIRDGYKYYGWAYESGIVDKDLINTDPFEYIIEDKDIKVYLYYTMDISVLSSIGGDAEIDKATALYGEEVNLQATAFAGYDFVDFTYNGSQIGTSDKLCYSVFAPSKFIANFEGRIVDIILIQVENATISIKDFDASKPFRVGDTLNLVVNNVKLGYISSGIKGEFAGKFSGYTYVIVAKDAEKGYAKFSPNVYPIKVAINIAVENNEGGVVIFKDKELTSYNITMNYNDNLTLIHKVTERYKLSKITLNNLDIDFSSSVVVCIENGFNIDETNIIKIYFEKMLWINEGQEFAGSGTEENPYIINTINELAYMAYLINNNVDSLGTVDYADAYYLVTSSIDLTEKFWQPIGVEENPFNGTFNYNNFAVKGIYLDKNYDVLEENSLFGYVTKDAKFIKGAGISVKQIIFIVTTISIIILIIIIIILIVASKKKKIKQLEGETQNDLLNKYNKENKPKRNKKNKLKNNDAE